MRYAGRCAHPLQNQRLAPFLQCRCSANARRCSADARADPLQNQALEVQSNREPRMRNGASLLGNGGRDDHCSPTVCASAYRGLMLFRVDGVRWRRHCTSVIAGLAARRVGAEAAPVAALFFLEHCAHGSVYGGPCGEGASPARTYSWSANPARSATPTLGGVGGRF